MLGNESSVNKRVLFESANLFEQIVKLLFGITYSSQATSFENRCHFSQTAERKAE